MLVAFSKTGNYANVWGEMVSSQAEFGGSVNVCDRQQDSEKEVVEHLPMVKKIAQHIHGKLPKGVAEFDDLVSVGMFGLLEASRRYDPSRDISFATFAYPRIRGAILDNLREDDRGSRTLRKKAKTIEQTVDRLSKSFGRYPTEAEVVDALNMTISEYQSLVFKIWSLAIISLDASDDCTEQSSDRPLNRIPDPSSITPLAVLEKKETSAHLLRAIESLSERERRVVSHYYFREMTMKEIGADLGVMESCVSKIHAKAVLKMRATVMDRTTPPYRIGIVRSFVD